MAFTFCPLSPALCSHLDNQGEAASGTRAMPSYTRSPHFLSIVSKHGIAGEATSSTNAKISLEARPPTDQPQCSLEAARDSSCFSHLLINLVLTVLHSRCTILHPVHAEISQSYNPCHRGWRDGSAGQSAHCFAEDPSSVPGTHIIQFTTTGDSSSRVPNDTVPEET